MSPGGSSAAANSADISLNCFSPLDLGREPVENKSRLIIRGWRYVGVQTDLRESAIFLFGVRRRVSDRIDVFEPLVLADNMLCRRHWLARRRAGPVSQAT